MKRGCGILLPISSLPGNYGIGGFSKEAYRFVDKLRAAAQCYWQILPLGPTGTGDHRIKVLLHLEEMSIIFRWRS